MEKTVIKTGKTVDEAIEAALSELGCTKEQATVEVVEEGTEGGFLGLGRKDAEVKVTFNSDEAAEEAAASEDSDDTYYGDDESFEGDAVSEAEDAAANFVAEVLSGIGIHGNMDSYREDDTIFISQRVHVYLDVGGYRKHREQVIKGLADKAVSRVRRSGRKVVMEAMSPAERRIVHSYLQEVKGVTTHSEGVEPNRCVVVTPEDKK